MSQSFLRINGVQKLASAVISPAKLKTLGAVFTWLFLLLDAEQLFTTSPINGVQSAVPRY
ncbi:hypothetical protein NI447_00890 [Enterococcus lactis]|nr:hypothetical protein [Enterococcus lactis]